MTHAHRFRHVLDTASPWRRFLNRLDALSPALTALHEAREGGLLSKAIAAGSIVSAVSDAIGSGRDPEVVLKDRGFASVQGELVDLYVGLLSGTGWPMRVERIAWAATIFYDPPKMAKGCVAFVIEPDSGCVESLFVHRTADLGAILRAAVWTDAADRALTVGGGATTKIDTPDGGEARVGTPSSDFHLSSLPPTPEYIGAPKVDWYVARLRAYAVAGRGPARTILLRGPSGVGKSLLARRIASAFRPEGSPGGALVVAAAVLEALDTSALVDLVRCVQPAALVLNDCFSQSYGSADDGDLAFTEALHETGVLTIATHMVGLSSGRNLNEDRLARGFRPGRIDEVFFLHPPGIDVRRAFLRTYLPAAVVEDAVVFGGLVRWSDKLTGAYLVDLAKRIEVHGPKGWKAELSSIRVASGLSRTPWRSGTKKAASEAVQYEGPVRGVALDVLLEAG